MSRKNLIVLFGIFLITILVSAATTYMLQRYQYQKVVIEPEQAIAESYYEHQVNTDQKKSENSEEGSQNRQTKEAISPQVDSGAEQSEDNGEEYVNRVHRQTQHYAGSFFLRGSNRPQVAITFDDGPSPHHTSVILDILSAYDVPATFFVLGYQVEYYPELVKRISREGHELGNHSYSHSNFLELSPAEVEGEINRVNELLEKIVGYKPALIRPPYGSVTDKQIELLKDKNYYLVNWSLDTMDWNKEANNVNDMLSRTENLLHPGAIILLHDSGGNRDKTEEILPKLIEYIQDKGYELVTVSDILSKPSKNY
ncbi:MAG: polysaccharide deacetylase family protein [Bacillota bacterium]